MDKNIVLVIGTGISGVSACDLLVRNGVSPVLFDSNDKLDIETIKNKLEFPDKVKIILGDLKEDIKESVGTVVLSPGVPVDAPMVVELVEKGAKLSGEIELAYTYEKGSLIAITGTNGKTTTTALTGKIISDYNSNSFVVGNIGNPYTGEVTASTEDSVTVAEISSFQLETTDTFKPHVSAILNITPDHLNRHHTMETYIKVKENITVNQDSDDYVILNYEDTVLREFAKNVKAKVIFFSSKTKLVDGFYYEDNNIYLSKDGKASQLISSDEMQIIGVHNMENAMAAIAMTYAFGVPMDSILKSVKEFTAVEHRIEFVAEKKGVRYYNDSKGTNVDAAIKGIEAMNRPTYLIGGGYDKGSAFDDWILAFNGKVKKLVLIGATKHVIADCCKKHGFNDWVLADTFEEAFNICANEAKEGEAVLLSPACASWGMFDNYEQRGNIFKEYVNRL